MKEQSAENDRPRKEQIGDRSYIVWDEDTVAAFTPSDVMGDYVDSVSCACGVTCDPRDPDHAAHRVIPPARTEEES